MFRAAVLTGALLVAATSVWADDDPNMYVSSLAHRDITRELQDTLYAAGADEPSLAARSETARFALIESEDIAEVLLASGTKCEGCRTVCAVRDPEPLVAMGPVDGSGTPYDWTRRAMLARGGDPIAVFAASGSFARIVMGALAAVDGVSVDVRGAMNDAEALALAKRAGDGLALIDARHADARGYGLVLDIDGTGDGDAPGLLDLGLDALPPRRFTAVLLGPEAGPEMVAVAERACGAFGEAGMSEQEVSDAVKVFDAFIDLGGTRE